MRVIKHYRIHLGTWAFILHRLAGLALIFYLVLHIWVIHHLINGQSSFDEVMGAFNTPLFKLLEGGLIGVILYHMFNGLRLTLMDIGFMVERQKALFAIAVVLWLISWFAIGSVMVARLGELSMGLVSTIGRWA